MIAADQPFERTSELMAFQKADSSRIAFAAQDGGLQFESHARSLIVITVRGQIQQRQNARRGVQIVGARC